MGVLFLQKDSFKWLQIGFLVHVTVIVFAVRLVVCRGSTGLHGCWWAQASAVCAPHTSHLCSGRSWRITRSRAWCSLFSSPIGIRVFYLSTPFPYPAVQTTAKLQIMGKSFFLILELFLSKGTNLQTKKEARTLSNGHSVITPQPFAWAWNRSWLEVSSIEVLLLHPLTCRSSLLLFLYFAPENSKCKKYHTADGCPVNGC